MKVETGALSEYICEHLAEILEFAIISDANWNLCEQALGFGRNILESAEVSGNVLKSNDIILFVFRLCLRRGLKLMLGDVGLSIIKNPIRVNVLIRLVV